MAQVTWLLDQILTAIFGRDLSLPSESDGQAGVDAAMSTQSAVDFVLALLPTAIGRDASIRDFARASVLGDCLYYWGRPNPIDGDVDAMVASGADCSGSVLTALVSAGIISAELANDIRTAELIGIHGTTIDGSAVYPGCVACYGEDHVALVISYPEDDGTVWVLSMSGGGKTTKGNDTNARAKVLKSTYWSKFTKFVYL